MIGVALILVIGGYWYLGEKNQQKTATNEPIKIGAVYPLTGPLAIYGVEFKRGVEMAVEEINATGGVKGQKIDVIYEDDAGDTTKSVTAVNKLINVDGVKYLLTAFSSVSPATSVIAENNKVLYITAVSYKIGNGSYVFRDFWDTQMVGNAIGKAISNQGIKKLGALNLNFGDTDNYMAGVKETATGVQIKEERFSFGDTDFKTQLTKIKSFEPEAILVWAFPGAESTKFTQQIITLGLDDKKLFAGATTYTLPFMYEPFSDTLAKMRTVDTDYYFNPENIKAEEYIKNYSNKYGNRPPTGDSGYTYDDIYALKNAIENSGINYDTLKVANELRKIKMEGVAGELSFDEKGNSVRKVSLQMFTKNGWVNYSL